MASGRMKTLKSNKLKRYFRIGRDWYSEYMAMVATDIFALCWPPYFTIRDKISYINQESLEKNNISRNDLVLSLRVFRLIKHLSKKLWETRNIISERKELENDDLRKILTHNSLNLSFEDLKNLNRIGELDIHKLAKIINDYRKKLEDDEDFSEKGFVYLMQIRFKNKKRGPLKIGHSFCVRNRLNEIQISNPYKVELLTYLKADKETERTIQNRFSKYGIRGEWFKPVSEILEYFNIET